MTRSSLLATQDVQSSQHSASTLQRLTDIAEAITGIEGLQHLCYVDHTRPQPLQLGARWTPHLEWRLLSESKEARLNDQRPPRLLSRRHQLRWRNCERAVRSGSQRGRPQGSEGRDARIPCPVA